MARRPRPEKGHDVAMGLVPGPFHSRLAPLNRQHSWTGWMGYASPIVFDNVEFEYFAIRNQATLYDISPMCKYAIEGPDAERVVNRLVTRDIRKVAPGRVAYAIWCDEDGNVIDDGTLCRLAADRFRLCCQEPQLAWLEDIAWGFDVTIRDVSQDIAALSLQGPTSAAILRDLGVAAVETMKPFDAVSATLGGLPIELSRTGFTGDLGYELWMRPRDAIAIWDTLQEAGRIHGLRPVGYQAVDMARIEAGFLLPRVDFLSSRSALRPDRAVNPFELGLGRMVDFDKPHFNGRRALMTLRDKPPRRKLVRLEVGRDKPAVNALVYHRRKKEVGMVTSALWSPTCKRNMAFAWLEAPYGQDIKSDLWVEIYLQREIRWQRRMERCTIIDQPFFSNRRRSKTPPDSF